MLGRIRKLALLLGIVGGCASPSVPEANTSTLTGEAAELSDRPEIGILAFDIDGDGRREGNCTATLITPTTLISAAHCLTYERYGFIDRETEALVLARDVVVHPDYDPARPWEYDLGVVVLEAPIDAPPMVLLPEAPAVDEPVTLVGAGETQFDERDNGVLRIGSNEVETVQELFFVTRGGAAPESNGCRGDSGGPVFVTRTRGDALAGVMSYVPGLGGAGSCGDAMRTTRLDLYLDWIRDNADGDVVTLDELPPPEADAGFDAGASDVDAGLAADDGGSTTERDAGAMANFDASPMDDAAMTAPIMDEGCAAGGRPRALLWSLALALVSTRRRRPRDL